MLIHLIHNLHLEVAKILDLVLIGQCYCVILRLNIDLFIFLINMYIGIY